MLIYTLCVLLGVVSQLTAIEERIGDRDAPKLEGGRIDPDLEGDKPDDRFLTVDEELARIDLLPKISFEKLTPEVQKWQTEELKIVEALIGKQILQNDGKFHLDLIAPSVSIELNGTKLNVEMTAEAKTAKEAELEPYLHGQSLEQRLAVWGHQANISALIKAHRTSQPLTYSAFDIARDDLFEFDIVLDLYDVVELEEEIVEQIRDGVFPKDKVTIPGITLHPLPTKPPSDGLNPRGIVKREAEEIQGSDNTMDEDMAKNRQKRKMRNSKKWNLPIKYKFGNSMTQSEKDAINEALAYWTSLTCITFSYSPSTGWPTNRIVFKKITSTTICGSSPVGKRSFGLKNQIEIACFNMATIVHEVGHSLGFYHEQSRPDRDTYVKIHWDNIPDWAHHNFGKKSALTYSIPYDYSSIMHYSSVVWGGVAITAKDNNYTPLMGQREGLTFFDVKLANFHYCANKCPPYNSLGWSYCHNRGYRDPKNCLVCRCPTGFKGSSCAALDPVNVAECGSPTRIASTTTQYIQSPNYGTGFSNHYSQNDKCTWLIHGPSGGRVIAWFVSTFRLRWSGRCSVDSVEVRYGDVAAPGPKYCGFSTPSITFTSVDSKLMVLFESTGATSTAYKGFKMAYKTQSCGLCDYAYSPSQACRHVVSYAKESTYYTRCGWWGKRCPRQRYSLAYKYQDTCCHGVLVGSQCQVSGCGGCTDKIVKNQPKCVPYAKSKYTSESYTYGCGWWGKRCTRYRKKAVYYWYTPPACCSGYTLIGNRCIKD